MLESVGPEGTGRNAQVEGLEVAGKTGTAEPGHYADQASQQGKDNGWFVGFAPARNPKLVVGVVVLGGGFAGASAAPIARDIFGAWHRLASN
jgi:peptidoglycan glycosyltransferase